MVGAANADGRRRRHHLVPGAIGTGDPAADNPQRPGEQPQGETIGRLVLGGKVFRDKLGARANGDESPILGLEHCLGQGGGAHSFADEHHVTLAQFSFSAGSGRGDLAADMQHRCKLLAAFPGRCGGMARQGTSHEDAEKAHAREEDTQP